MSTEAPVRRDAGDQPPPVQKSYVFEAVSITISVLLWLVVLFQVLFIVPKFIQIFNEFRMRLPQGTEFVMNNTIWLAPVVMFVTFLMCIPIRSRWLWLLLLIGVPILFNLSVMLNLLMPYMTLQRALQQ